MKPITELNRIDPQVIAALGMDQEGMGHAAKLTVQDPNVFLTVLGIVKATNLNDRGGHSPAGDIGVAFSVGFLTAWHICQGNETELITQQFARIMGRFSEDPDEPQPPQPPIKAHSTQLVMSCIACHGNGIIEDGVACEVCNGFGHVPLEEVKEMEDTGGDLAESLDTIDNLLECSACGNTGIALDDSGEPVQCKACRGDCV